MVRIPCHRSPLVVHLLLPLCVVSTARAQAPAQPTSRDVMSVPRQEGPISLAPSGDLVAYLTRTVDWDNNRSAFVLWVARPGAEPVRIADSLGPNLGAPRWSPRGEWLAFPALTEEGRQIWLADHVGGQPVQLTRVEGGVGDFRWSPDGERIAFGRVERESPAQEDADTLAGTAVVAGSPVRPENLWVIDVPPAGSSPGDAAEPRRLTAGEARIGAFAWSPDGRRIAFQHRPTDSESWWETDISVVDVGSGSVQRVVDHPGPDWWPRWSPDGRWLLYSTKARGAAFHRFHSWRLAKVPASGGEPVVLTEDIDANVYGIATMWLPQGILLVTGRGAVSSLFLLDPETRDLTEVGGLPDGEVGFFDVSGDARTVAFAADRPTHLREIYLTRLDPFRPRRLTDLTSHVAEWPLGTPEMVAWRSWDGEEIEGVLRLPPGFDGTERHPLLVLLHGGPMSIVRPRLLPGPLSSWWLMHGGIVLAPNFRGSEAYGERFRRLNVGCLGECEARDIISGVDALADRGIVDMERVAAAGWSHGGYLAAFLATRSRRFRAISVGAADIDLRLSYAASDNQDYYESYLGGTPWENPEPYERLSPITTVAEACTPTIIHHGRSDGRVPPANARLLYRGLEDSGVATRLILYDAGHVLRPREELARVRHDQEWLVRHVLEPPQASGRDSRHVPERCQS